MLSNSMEQLNAVLSCITYNGKQHTHILLQENDDQAILKKITLLMHNGNWLSLNPDDGRKCSRIEKGSHVTVMSPLLAIAQRYHRACDGVVLINQDDKLIVLYIDLKSNNPTKYANQFKSTRQFVRYALGILKEFHDYDLVIEKECYIIFYGGRSTSIRKTPTVPKKINQTQPDNPLKKEMVNNGRISLKELLDMLNLALPKNNGNTTI